MMIGTKFTYRLKFKNSYPSIEVNGYEMKRPDFLCKYYSINERNVSAIISRQIFVSNPDLLNDLFDTLFLKIEIDKSQINIYRALMANVDMAIDEQMFNNSQQYRELLRTTLCAIWTSFTGILCMTEDTINDLMWAHYTNNEGFLIQFDFKHFPKNFGEPYPINYLKNDQFSEYNYSNPFLQLYVNSLLKKECWNYENEYRFIVHPRHNKTFLTSGRFSNEHQGGNLRDNRLQTYSKECVKKIILGFDFFKSITLAYNEVDFGKSGGLLKKSLLDFALGEKIPLEILRMNHKKMKFEPVNIELKKNNELIFEIKYSS